MIVAAAEGDRAPVFKIRSAAIHKPVADAKPRSINPPEPAAADGRGDFKIALVAVLLDERIDDLIFTHGMGPGHSLYHVYSCCARPLGTAGKPGHRQPNTQLENDL